MFKRSAPIVLSIVVIAGPGVARAAAQPPDATEVERVENARLDAMFKGDIDAVAAVIADEFILTSANGQVSDRTQYLARLRAAQGPRPQLLHDEVKVQVFGDAAIITGRSRSVVNGEERPGRVRYTHVYVRRNGAWQMVAMHVSTIGPVAP
jgi:ketosteroid isomerase-like protein